MDTETKTKTKTDTKITILLTSTVFINYKLCCIHQTNPVSRIETYIKSVQQWLEKTNFNIVLVENSGFHYDVLKDAKDYYNNRFEVITFKEEELEEAKYLVNNRAKGGNEVFAINYAYQHSRFLQNSDFIIKLTGRYFIPEFEEYLREIDLDKYDCLTQHNRDRCELVGSHSRMFSFIFNIHLMNDNNKYDGHIENIWKMRTSKCANVFVCKEFKIEPTVRGGVDKSYDTI